MERKQSQMIGVAAGLLALSGSAVAMNSNNDETWAIVNEMLADSESRSSLLGSGDAGHDGKFFIAGDGYRLNIGGMTQLRYYLNFRDDANNDDFTPGFEVEHTRLYFKGTINDNWEFKIKGEFDSEGGAFELYEAWAGYNFANGWGLYGGQVKVPLIREDMVDEAYQLAVDRSVTAEYFRPDRTKGVWVQREWDSYRVWFVFNDGADAANTAFNGSNADFAFTGRGEWKVSGDWDQFQDFTSLQGEEQGLMIGAAGHYQQSRNTNNPTDVDTDVFIFTVDASFEQDGFNAFAAFIGQIANIRATGIDEDVEDFGAVIQGGYRFTETSEIFARWDGLFLDEDRPGLDEDTFNFITFGYNQYFAGHAAKFTLDAVLALESTADLDAAVPGSLSNGLLGDVEDNEVVVRAQFQLMF